MPSTLETNMSEQVPTKEMVSKHRHSWIVAWSYKVPGGRTKEQLRCRFCEARKGRFIKAQACDCVERGEPDIECPNHGIDAVQRKRVAQPSVQP